MDTIDIRICGIPAKADILHYHGGRSARLNCHPDDAMPEEPAEVDFVICDRNGRTASWLLRKAEAQGIDLEQLVLDAIQAEGEPA